MTERLTKMTLYGLPIIIDDSVAELRLPSKLVSLLCEPYMLEGIIEETEGNEGIVESLQSHYI